MRRPCGRARPGGRPVGRPTSVRGRTGTEEVSDRSGRIDSGPGEPRTPDEPPRTRHQTERDRRDAPRRRTWTRRRGRAGADGPEADATDRIAPGCMRETHDHDECECARTDHPGGGDHTDAYPRKLDDGAYWVLLLGGELDLDWYAYHFSNTPMAVLVRGSASLNKDCSDVWAGFLHLGPHFNLALGERFAFRIGIGPTLVWRQNWNGRVANYTGDTFYGKTLTNDAFQSRLIWYGGNMELEWKVKRNVSLIFSNIPGWPHIITSSIGARYSF